MNDRVACINIKPMQEYSASPLWRRILNACLAGLSGIIGVDMALAWGWHFMVNTDGNVPTEELTTQSHLTITTIVVYLSGLIFSAFLSRWQWKRSAKSNQMHETLMTGEWLLLCILLLMRPRF
ncbi:MAG: hypothetical protein HOH33_10410 [Verrucomicrobia bacterium]|nr:hypothetical protein [Verrucomicrobiota bacterium]